MNHKGIFAAVVPVAALAATMTTAQAAQPGFYVGGLYGQSDKQIGLEGFDLYGATRVFPSPSVQLTVESMTASLDESDAGFGFIAGYRFTPHFAVEGGYLDLGKVAYRAQLRGNITGVPTDAMLNVDTDTAGIAVSALGVWPLSYRWEVFGRAGALFARNDFRALYDDVERRPRRDEYAENSIDMLAGIGTSFNFLEIYDLRLEYQRVFDAGDDTTGEGDVDLISIGITVMF